MLFDDPILYFRGLTIFRDFSNSNLYYFLPPEAPRIARSAEDSQDYALRLVIYRPDPNAPPPQGMENGGGFLNLDVDLHVPPQLLEQATEEIRRRFGGQASLVPVPFTQGSVELVLLGVGREDEGQPFVRKVAGSTVPALYGTQRSAFSVVLDRDGAALMQQVIREGGATMALAIYHLTYAGIGPAYNLKITIDYERVFEQLDLRLRAGISASSGSSSFVGKAGFHMLMEELRERRAILVEETDPIPGENGRTPIDQTKINEIIGNLMGSKWFKPTLAQAAQMTNVSGGSTPGGSTPGGGTGSSGTGSSGTGSSGSGAASGTSGTASAAARRRNAQWQEDSRTPAEFPSGRGVGPFTPSTSGTRETLTVRGQGATAKVGPRANALETAQIRENRLAVDLPGGQTRHVEITWPASGGGSGERPAAAWTESPGQETTPDRGVEPFQPSSSGTQETLRVRGEGATVKVGPAAESLHPRDLTGNSLQIDVPPGQTQHVEITWPETEGQEDTFHLFYDYERPTDANDVTGYSNRSPSPAEGSSPRSEGARFLTESRARTSSGRGPDALDAWLGTLNSGTTLELHAHASYEGDNSTAKQASNRQLSDRRMSVAEALIAGRVPTNPSRPTHGHDRSKARQVEALPGDNPPANSRGGRPQDRVVLITGRLGGRSRTVLRGQLRRGQPGERPGQPQSVLRGHMTRAGNGGGRRTTPSDETKIEASFEINLEMIEREERVSAVYELNSRKARTHEVHPQGQLVLDVLDPLDYIIEADGALDFFQKLEVAASTTAQWQFEGIDSIHVEIRYAPLNGDFRRRGEIVLSAAQEQGSWTSGVLRETDDDRSPVLYSYEYRVTVHYLPDVALGDQSGAVTSVGAPGADAEGWKRSTERNLVIHPRDVTPAVTVNVASGIMRFDLLQRAQLVLLYGPYRQNLTLSAEHPEHRLVIRPEPGLEDAVLRTEGTLFYTDGAQVSLPPHEWTPQELIVINEPRENVLRVQVILADPADEYERVLVRLRYEHDNRVVEESRELTDHAQLEDWAVRLEDPEQRAWTYQATLIKRSGDIDTTDWTEGEEGQLVLGVRAVDVIPVQITWLLPPPAGELLAVKIDLRYEDERNDVRWDHSELIRGEHSGDFTWSIPIVDPELRGYRYRVTEFRQTGAQEGPWQDSTEERLVLLPGA